ncbi:hypothetical protein L6164_023748 [Bauhinia variegata]|uniref:Uncharacterized protein n=1 Tax=Bauhinia variegata TaxID=167791 RepID=A0ACB9MKM2_BAUVA|nr:hypothetical protein L6164_023748 [Bauhinia variegata]
MARFLTLINFVLETIPIYNMFTTMIPKEVLNEIKRIQRRFLWRHGLEEGKIHYVSWNTICQPKQCGGLGIRGLHLMNVACFLKAGWRMKENTNELWKQVIRGKYGRNAD